MYRTWFFLIALALPAGSAAIADPLSNGTKEERAACAPEAVKFCKHELDVNASDNAAILKCLQRNRQKISAQCQAVLKNHGQ
jgi:cysteine rich repeat protein